MIRWRDTPLVREFQSAVADVNKQIRIDFWGVKCVSGENDQPYRENISYYMQSVYLVEQQEFPEGDFPSKDGDFCRSREFWQL